MSSLLQESTLLTDKLLYSCVLDTQDTIRKNLMKRRLSRLLHLLLSQLHFLLLGREERLRLKRLLHHPPHLLLLLLDRRLWMQQW